MTGERSDQAAQATEVPAPPRHAEHASPPAIGAAARRRGVFSLLLSTGLMFGGFFMLVPLISVHYTQRLGFPAAAVGLALALRQLTQQGLTLFGGVLADRVGPRRLIILGALVRLLGFAGLAWATTLPLLLLMCTVAALGGALFDAPSSAALTTLTHPRERARVFSLLGVAGGIGMTLGPLLGGFLVRYDFAVVCFVSAACFGGVGLLTALMLPEVRPPPGSQPSFLASMGRIWHDRVFVTLTLLLCGYWFLWVQIAISLPLAAERLAWAPMGEGPLASAVAWALTLSTPVSLVYTLNALLTIGLQYQAVRLTERWLAPATALALGVGLVGLGLACVPLATSMLGLLGCVALFSLGTLLVAPTSRTITAQIAPAEEIGAYFGASALAVAFGGGLGNFAGGWLTDVGAAAGTPALPWLIFGAVGLAAALGLLALGQVMRRAALAEAPLAARLDR
jgi:MFS transporter, DHA1 family, multidrug resistance protein